MQVYFPKIGTMCCIVSSYVHTFINSLNKNIQSFRILTFHQNVEQWLLVLRIFLPYLWPFDLEHVPNLGRRASIQSLDAATCCCTIRATRCLTMMPYCTKNLTLRDSRLRVWLPPITSAHSSPLRTSRWVCAFFQMFVTSSECSWGFFSSYEFIHEGSPLLLRLPWFGARAAKPSWPKMAFWSASDRLFMFVDGWRLFWCHSRGEVCVRLQLTGNHFQQESLCWQTSVALLLLFSTPVSSACVCACAHANLSPCCFFTFKLNRWQIFH